MNTIEICTYLGWCGSDTGLVDEFVGQRHRHERIVDQVPLSWQPTSLVLAVERFQMRIAEKAAVFEHFASGVATAGVPGTVAAAAGRSGRDSRRRLRRRPTTVARLSRVILLRRQRFPIERAVYLDQFLDYPLLRVIREVAATPARVRSNNTFLVRDQDFAVLDRRLRVLDFTQPQLPVVLVTAIVHRTRRAEDNCNEFEQNIMPGIVHDRIGRKSARRVG